MHAMLYSIFAPLLFLSCTFFSVRNDRRLTSTKFVAALVSVTTLLAMALRIHSDLVSGEILLISPFLLPCLLIASALTIAIGFYASKDRYRIGLALLVPMLFFMHSGFAVQKQLENEKDQALYFLVKHQGLAQYIGRRPEGILTSLNSDLEEEKARYVFSIAGSRHLYAYVDITRTSEESVFKLACVSSTPLHFGDFPQDSCKNDDGAIY
jgi:hypothetical protein